MQSITLTSICIHFAYLIFGYFLTLYLYKREDFPRSSRLIWGQVYILYGFVGILFSESSLADVMRVKELLPYKALVETGALKYEIAYTFLKFILPFSFAAVGAGLIANSLVSPRTQ